MKKLIQPLEVAIEIYKKAFQEQLKEELQKVANAEVDRLAELFSHWVTIKVADDGKIIIEITQ